VFLVNPAGLLHVLVYSNCSFARPDLKQIVQGELHYARCKPRSEGMGALCLQMADALVL